MKITVNLGVSQNTDSYNVDLDDLNYSESEWEELSTEQKESVLQEFINELPSQPYWMLENFKEE